jgi:hypothetical protein
MQLTYAGVEEQVADGLGGTWDCVCYFPAPDMLSFVNNPSCSAALLQRSTFQQTNNVFLLQQISISISIRQISAKRTGIFKNNTIKPLIKSIRSETLTRCVSLICRHEKIPCKCVQKRKRKYTMQVSCFFYNLVAYEEFYRPQCKNIFASLISKL